MQEYTGFLYMNHDISIFIIVKYSLKENVV